MKLSIIIPVYNEEKTISQILNIVKKLQLPGNLEKEIIVVDDGSTDNTEKVLSEFKMENLKCKILRHEKNKGKGAAVRTGLQEANGQIFLIQDADLEYNPQDYQKLLTPILEKRTQVVYGTRLKNYPLKFWGKNKTVLPTHLIANKFLTALTNILYFSNLTDMETCYKIFTKEVIKDITIKANRFDFEPELTAKILKKRIKIVEIPIISHPRTYSEGKKIGVTDFFIAIWTLFKYRFIN